jgi:hypothetical protein
VSCDQKDGRANSSKQSLVGQLEFYAGLTGAEAHDSIRFQSLDEHLLSGGPRPGRIGQTGGYTHDWPVAGLKNADALIADALINEGRSACLPPVEAVA